MSEGSTPTKPHRRPVRSSDLDVVDPPPRGVECTRAGRPWHPLDADSRAICSCCFPAMYSVRHAKHRSDFSYSTTVARGVTR